MTYLKILNQSEKHEIKKKLEEQFEIENIPYILIMRGEERLFLFSGNLNENDIKKMEEIVPIEKIGIYFAKIIKCDLKLSIEGTQIFKNHIKKNIFELNSEQAEEWMMGRDLNIKTGKKGFLVMKYEDDFLGCGKASEEKIGNFIPKNRRLKQRNN